MPQDSVYSHWWRCQIMIVEVENSMLVTWTNETKTRSSRTDHSMLSSKRNAINRCQTPYQRAAPTGHGNHILRNDHLLP